MFECRKSSDIFHMFGKFQPSLQYTRMQFIRYTTEKWDATTQVVRLIHFLVFLFLKSKILKQDRRVKLLVSAAVLRILNVSAAFVI